MSSIYLEKVEFRPIPGYAGLFVSADGVAVSTRTGNRKRAAGVPLVKRQHPDKDGYARIATKGLGNGAYITVHQAVLLAWSGPKPPKSQSRHLDGNKANNSIQNLCWGSSKENNSDKIGHGTVARGERNARARLTEEKVLSMRRECLDKPMAVIIRENPQYSEFAVWAAISGYSWAHLPGAITGRRKCSKQGWRSGQKLNKPNVQT